ncbi:MAG: hypothetical protein WC860_03220 [Candidatus Margulisiibacteriota bacterium]|jgi:septal ring factor EnvC (AmiA/AmiB activator)
MILNKIIASKNSEVNLFDKAKIQDKNLQNALEKLEIAAAAENQFPLTAKKIDDKHYTIVCADQEKLELPFDIEKAPYQKFQQSVFNKGFSAARVTYGLCAITASIMLITAVMPEPLITKIILAAVSLTFGIPSLIMLCKNLYDKHYYKKMLKDIQTDTELPEENRKALNQVLADLGEFNKKVLGALNTIKSEIKSVKKDLADLNSKKQTVLTELKEKEKELKATYYAHIKDEEIKTYQEKETKLKEEIKSIEEKLEKIDEQIKKTKVNLENLKKEGKQKKQALQNIRDFKECFLVTLYRLLHKPQKLGFKEKEFLMKILGATYIAKKIDLKDLDKLIKNKVLDEVKTADYLASIEKDVEKIHEFGKKLKALAADPKLINTIEFEGLKKIAIMKIL